MPGQKKQGSKKYGPLSPKALAWEAERLRALGLTDVVWKADVCCLRCRRAERADLDDPAGGTSLPPWWDRLMCLQVLAAARLRVEGRALAR